MIATNPIVASSSGHESSGRQLKGWNVKQAVRETFGPVRDRHIYRGVEKLASRRSHSPEIAGSSPVAAISMRMWRVCLGNSL